MASDDKESAAEVAYALLRKLGSGRRQNQSNPDYYRRQTVEILTSAGRMEPLIERAERRLKTSPSSMRVRSELAELYTAAGRSDDAAALWEDAPTDRPVDARQLLSRAAALAKSKKHKEAAEMYLDAFEKDPSLMNNSYYEMRRAVQAAKCEDAMFERLLEFDPAALSSYRLGEFVSMGDRQDFSEAKRKFIGHALKSPYGRQNFYSILRNVPDSERKNIPGIQETVVMRFRRRQHFGRFAAVQVAEQQLVRWKMLLAWSLQTRRLPKSLARRQRKPEIMKARNRPLSSCSP